MEIDLGIFGSVELEEWTPMELAFEKEFIEESLNAKIRIDDNFKLLIRDKESARDGKPSQHGCSVKILRGNQSIPVFGDIVNGKLDTPYYPSEAKFDSSDWDDKLEYGARLLIDNFEDLMLIWNNPNDLQLHQTLLTKIERNAKKKNYFKNKSLDKAGKSIFDGFGPKPTK